MDEAPDKELLAEVAAMRASRRRGLGTAIAASLAVALLYPVWRVHAEQVTSFLRGESDLDGEPVYEPPHPPDPAALSRIDFERVHAQLIPTWTVAMANATSGYWQRRADERFDELAAEVAPDPNLSELLRATHQDLRSAPLERARRLDYRLWAYNDYLDQQGIPWRLDASLAFGGARPVFRTLSYEVLADERTPEGHRLRLLRRADRINTLEGWLGRTGRPADGAMVLMRRVLHFTVRHVWPALHPALDARRPDRERSWLPYVRDEVASALPDATFRLLTETAVDQQALIEVAEAVAARESCGSRFRVYDLPYNGLSSRSVDALMEALARGRAHPDCPEITVDEAARIVGASERLGATDGLEAAMEELAMVVARSVAAHELRHVADGDELACPGCPEGLVGLARDEVSAYLATLATDGLGYLALLQACATPPSPTVHGAALAAVLEAILPYGCEGPTLHGLYEVARQIEAHLFGERAAVAVPNLPPRVLLLPRPARADRLPPRGSALEDGWGVRVGPH